MSTLSVCDKLSVAVGVNPNFGYVDNWDTLELFAKDKTTGKVYKLNVYTRKFEETDEVDADFFEKKFITEDIDGFKYMNKYIDTWLDKILWGYDYYYVNSIQISKKGICINNIFREKVIVPRDTYIGYCHDEYEDIVNHVKFYQEGIFHEYLEIKWSDEEYKGDVPQVIIDNNYMTVKVSLGQEDFIKCVKQALTLLDNPINRCAYSDVLIICDDHSSSTL